MNIQISLITSCKKCVSFTLTVQTSVKDSINILTRNINNELKRLVSGYTNVRALLIHTTINSKHLQHYSVEQLISMLIVKYKLNNHLTQIYLCANDLKVEIDTSVITKHFNINYC